jgi:hypothetical protein
MLVGQPVADQRLHGDHFQSVPGAEFDELRHARHGSIRIHDFADDAAGLKSAHPGQIDGRFGLSGAHQDSAFPRPQGKHVPWTGQIPGTGLGRHRGQDGMRAIARRNSCGDAFGRIDRLAECSAEARRIHWRYQRQVKRVAPLRREGQADQAAAVSRHEVNGFRRNALRGHG